MRRACHKTVSFPLPSQDLTAVSKSLFWNFLDVSYVFSILYRDVCFGMREKPRGVNILRSIGQKNSQSGRQVEGNTKSLFWNILPINSLFSIFCMSKHVSTDGKRFLNAILYEDRLK